MFDGQKEFVRVGLSTGEEVIVADVAQAALEELDLVVRRDGNDLVLPDSGYRFEPRLISLDERDDGSFQTSTIVRFSHPQLFPAPAFEYQHASGDTVAASVRSGFDTWSRMDVVTLFDALADEPRGSTFMDMSWPGDGVERKRRLVFGPTGHLAQNPDPSSHEDGDPCEHPFCPCCLTTNSMDAFRELLKDDNTYGLRLYAARMDGEVSADCRVNGEEYEPGKAALRIYATTWPDRGVEFRKQFVVIRSVDVG